MLRWVHAYAMLVFYPMVFYVFYKGARQLRMYVWFLGSMILAAHVFLAGLLFVDLRTWRHPFFLWVWLPAVVLIVAVLYRLRSEEAFNRVVSLNPNQARDKLLKTYKSLGPGVF